MSQNVVFGGPARRQERAVGSIACLAFVLLLASAFWAGALVLGQVLMRLFSLG